MTSQTPPSPTYRIFRDKHGIPQFEPKRGTQALKDALIYSFPTLETELQLMQAALRKFFDSERGSTFVFELPERDLQTSLAKKPDTSISPLQSSKASLRSWKVSRASRTPSRPSSRASSRAPSRASSRCETPTPFPEIAGSMTTWMLSNGQELEKRKRQPYDPVKRRKVAENRGNACEKHRASKTACNPEECPQNKLYGKTQRTRRESEASAYETPSEICNSEPNVDKAVITGAVACPMPMNPTTATRDLDIFFDAMDLPAPEISTGSPQLDYPSTGRGPAAWVDTLDIDDMSWSPAAPPAAVPGFLNMDDHTSHTNAILNTDRMDVSIDPFKDIFSNGPYTTQELHVVPEEVHAEHDVLASSATLEQHLTSFNASDDPFMGWASKRASNLIEEYGWVLSLVEAL